MPPFIPDFLSSRLALPHRLSFAPSLPGEVTAWALLVARMVVNWVRVEGRAPRDFAAP